MAFTIHHLGRNDRFAYDSYDDSHQIVVMDSGMIEVRKDGEQVRLYSPVYWTQVEPGEKHRTVPGRP